MPADLPRRGPRSPGQGGPAMTRALRHLHRRGRRARASAFVGETLIRAADARGPARPRGCDTHGLAQRGGIVASHVRIGLRCHSALVSEGSADLRGGPRRSTRPCPRAGPTSRKGEPWSGATPPGSPWPCALGRNAQPSAADVDEVAALRRGRAIRVPADAAPGSPDAERRRAGGDLPGRPRAGTRPGTRPGGLSRPHVRPRPGGEPGAAGIGNGEDGLPGRPPLQGMRVSSAAGRRPRRPTGS
ncbi:MAG: hypothetical protein MZU95_15595 [Desulfomicrobium escambiense]|nr:hypothetical protein [Desulfomicrobium escambiense]